MTLFDPAGLKERLDELNFIAEKPDFWSDQSAAQRLLREQKTLEKKLASYQRLVSGIEDIELTIELAESEDDAELAASVISDYDSLEAEIESLRLELLLNGKYDRNRAHPEGEGYQECDGNRAEREALQVHHHHRVQSDAKRVHGGGGK